MIEKGKKVTIHYKLLVDGHLIDSSDKSGPLKYEHGSGQIIPGLEKALEGLGSGDHKEVRIDAEDGYGKINPEAVIEIRKNQIQEKDVQVGAYLIGKSSGGRELQGVVTEIRDENVIVDFNHPLAGKDLLFEVEVLEVA